MPSEPRPAVRIAPNNQVFDLPVIVGIEEGLFEQAGLDVRFSATHADREKDAVGEPIMSRLKEQLFDCGSADSYNVCEWASIDRLERGNRGGNIAALRAAVAAQAILTFDDALQVPRDLADVPVVVQELTGSHYTTLQMLESAVGAEHVNIEPAACRRCAGRRSRDGSHRAITVMEPFISLGLKEGAHIIAASFYRGGEVIAADLTRRAAQGLLRRREPGGRSDQRRFLQICPPRHRACQGRARAARIAAGLRALQARRLLRPDAVRPRL